MINYNVIFFMLIIFVGLFLVYLWIKCVVFVKKLVFFNKKNYIDE